MASKFVWKDGDVTIKGPTDDEIDKLAAERYILALASANTLIDPDAAAPFHARGLINDDFGLTSAGQERLISLLDDNEGDRLDKIEERGDEWFVLSADGSKVLGKHKTKAAAEAQLRAIEANK